MAIFYTNQVTADPGGGAMFMASEFILYLAIQRFGKDTINTGVAKPIGGNILGHASTSMFMRRASNA